MGVQEWLAIPEIGDFTVKKQKREKFTPTPDNLLVADKQHSNMVIDSKSNGEVSSLHEVGLARSSLLSLKLEK